MDLQINFSKTERFVTTNQYSWGRAVNITEDLTEVYEDAEGR